VDTCCCSGDWIVEKDGSLIRPVADQAAYDHPQSIYGASGAGRLPYPGYIVRDGPQPMTATTSWDMHVVMADRIFFSTREDEQKLVSLVAVVYRMIEHCEETLQHTPRSYLCWLRSTMTEACYPKPFSLVSLKVSKMTVCRLSLPCFSDAIQCASATDADSFLPRDSWNSWRRFRSMRR
jgi:hypothetical protein